MASHNSTAIMSSTNAEESSNKQSSVQVQSKLNFTPSTKKEDNSKKENVKAPVTSSPSAVSQKNSSNIKEKDNDDDSVTQRKLTFLEEAENEDSECDDEEEYNEQVESEDEVNTVSSDKTTQRGKKKQSKKVLPPFTWYQLMIQLDQENNDSPIEDKDTEGKTPAQRLRDILITFVTQMHIYDPQAKIISWKTDPNFSYMDNDEFPTQIAQIAQYFNGYRANVKADRRIYLRVGVHTPSSQSQLYSFLCTWMELYGYTFNRCIIQAENAAYIGWLAYSTAYTDPEIFRKRLVEQSNFEWGFKLVAITTSDQDKQWMKRLKAVGIYVPAQMQNIAKLVLCQQIHPYEDTSIKIPDFTDKYLFVEPEKVYASKAGQLYYKKIVNRHRLHSDSVRAEFSFGIKEDLDREFNVGNNLVISIRDIILDLRVNDPDNPLYGSRLFHSVDYWIDSSKVWIDNNKGPGASSHVFTYYKQATSEASEMITGLGKLVLR